MNYSTFTVYPETSSETAEELQTNYVFSNEQAELALLILMLGITPAISIVGIIGNFFSILVLAKQKLKKSSNILLLALAISDTTFLIGFNSVPKFIYTAYGKDSFPYPEEASQILYILHEMLVLIDYGSGLASLTIPMLITIERLITIFQPLKVSRLITPQRTFIAICVVFIFWYASFTYIICWSALSETYDVALNRTVYVITRSALYEQDKSVKVQLEEMWTYFSLRIPAGFTFIGCVIIGVKLKVTSVKRRKLTGRKESGSMTRTTKTLLAVCGVYLPTCLIVLLPYFLPQQASYSVSEETSTVISQLLFQTTNVATCLNSSCNFIIYIVFNKNFREAYIALFIKDRRRNSALKKIND
ncbi:unnamed protein product [Candidula unifasciata]|uniref:G-protein coupled receptors family 1 profile domain-containing protein n=1 Tax=Candidula unifasciata TaxID=100452 RepID=A0A8S3YXL9_9EUPU|nr:unnamed protein product [Candidula unifasciata]